MAFSTRHKFDGEINGFNIKDIKLDYKKETLAERMEEVLGIINDTKKDDLGLFEKYVDEHYLASVSKNDEVSTNNDIFKKSEQLANYLLGSKEIREERQNTKYKFYTNEEEFKLRTKKENSLEGKTVGSQTLEEVIHFLLTKKGNHKLEKKQNLANVRKSISDETYVGKVLKNYDELYRITEDILKGNKPNDKQINRYILTRTMKGLEDDMIDSHDMLKGTFGKVLRNQLHDTTETNWNAIDLTNQKHIRPLLFVNKTKITPDDDLAFIVYDLNKVIKRMFKEGKEYKESTGKIKKGSLNETHLKLIQMIRQGYTISEISEFTGKSPQYISMTLDRISIYIANYHKVNGLE